MVGSSKVPPHRGQQGREGESQRDGREGQSHGLSTPTSTWTGFFVTFFCPQKSEDLTAETAALVCETPSLSRWPCCSDVVERAGVGVRCSEKALKTNVII